MLPLNCRVSHIDCYRAWLEKEDESVGWLLQQLTDSQPTEAMLKGTAFHKALELAGESEVDEIHQDGYVFQFEGAFEVALQDRRELRQSKDYGGLIVSGQVDCLTGNLITDYKTTGRFDAENYYRKYQWRYYLDIFRVDRFRWHVFEMRETEPKVYRVSEMHTLEQTRYPGMEADCRQMAHRFRDFCLSQNIQPAVPVPQQPVQREEPDGPLWGADGDLLPASRVRPSGAKLKFPEGTVGL